MKAICGLCDEVYEVGSERAKVHEHPEPQSGAWRQLWLDSRLPYEEWTKTETGRGWLEAKATAAALRKGSHV